MVHLAESGGVRARFAETRRLSILAEPVETRGLLLFAPPDRMVRITDGPRPMRLSIHGTRIAWSHGEDTRSLVVGEEDVAALLISDLMVLLRGDLDELERRHVVEYQASGSQWELELAPRDERVASMIERIRASGRGDRIEELEIVEVNGDTTTTHFADVETGLQWSEAELDEAFARDPGGATR